MTCEISAVDGMTQSELVALLHLKFSHIALTEIDAAIKHILSAMTQTLCAGARVEIRGFGSFSLRYRGPREARNPKSGKKVYVPGKSAPYFRASDHLRAQINISADAEQA